MVKTSLGKIVAVFTLILALMYVAHLFPTRNLASGLLQSASSGCNFGGTNVVGGTIYHLSTDYSAAAHWLSVFPPSTTPQVVAEGIVHNSGVSHTDYPPSHQSHDENFVVKLDPSYQGIASDHNGYIYPDPARLMEMEWEIGTDNSGITDRFPKEFWPWIGDRAWVMGHLIWDCGHEPNKTEIHPPSAVAFTRLEPTIFPGDTVPTETSKTFIYVHGTGGGVDFNTPVGGRNIEFDVPLPEQIRPTDPGFHLRTQVTAVPPVPMGPSPIVTPLPSDNPTRIHILYPLAGIPANPNNKFGAVVAVGWVGGPRYSSEVYDILRVTFDSIRVNNPHSEGIGPNVGDWSHLWAGVNGRWMELAGPSGNFGLNDVGAGNQRNFVGKSVELIVPESGAIDIRTTGWDSDHFDTCFGGTALCLAVPFSSGDNDPIGFINVHALTVLSDIGQHEVCSSRNPADNHQETACDFNLRYHIDVLGRLSPPPPIPPPLTRTQIISAFVQLAGPKGYPVGNGALVLGANSIHLNYRTSNIFGAYAQCRLLGFGPNLLSQTSSTFRSCNNPAIYRSLEPGQYTFQVRGVDDFGRVEPTVASLHWTVCEPKATSFENCLPSQEYPYISFNVSKAAFAHGQEPSNETVKIVNSQISQLTKQNSSLPFFIPVMIDSSLDGNKKIVKDGGTTTSSSIQFTFSSKSAASFQCFLDGKAASCLSPVIYNLLTTGPHTFQIFAVDKIKDVSKAPATFTWSIVKPK